ncbi:MAG: tyrosine-type recombinase/integrase [Lentihominibacter sp.]
MREKILRDDHIAGFREYLSVNEKSTVTISKYVRDVERFAEFAGQEPVDKTLVLEYKKSLMGGGYAVTSINSMLASLNSFLKFLGWDELKVKSLKVQHQIYCPEEKELTKEEYFRLLEAASNRPWLHLLLQTIGGTGIRVSEVSYFTVEAVKRGEVSVYCKDKIRSILIPSKLRDKILAYAREHGITDGMIFRTRSGRPLDRSNIWSAMKKLCSKAGINPAKVFPHNLRKLFARTFYSMEKDIAKLADILGHGSIDTTRIYIMATGREHKKKMERTGLVT